MGFKLGKRMNALPVSVDRGIVTVYIGNEKVQFDLGTARSLVFPKQCKHFLNKGIVMYVTNDEMGLVLRTDGTGSIYILKTRVLVSTFTYKMPEVPKYTSRKGGSLQLSSADDFSFINFYSNDSDTFLLMPESSPMSFVGSKLENKIYITDRCYISTDAYPILKVVKDELCATDAGGVIAYKLKGELYACYSWVLL